MNDNKYKYGFRTENKVVKSLDEKLSPKLIKKISAFKKDPSWMLDMRLKSLDAFFKIDQPSFGPSLKEVNFDDYIYYSASSDGIENDWEKVDPTLKNTFNEIGVIDAEINFLDGSSTQFDSETIYKNISKELHDQGVIFSNIETAMKDHLEIVKKYFGKLVNFSDNKYSALNTATWSGGSFIYVPKNIKLKKPLQSYFRINKETLGQFERTLIILEDNAELHYIEGCTAPTYKQKNLHAAVVEVFVGKGAKCRYTTIQNWSKNVINLVTKRARIDAFGSMSWIDGNIGSHINMKYPCSILVGDYASSDYVSVAMASSGVVQDTGAKMIHIGKNTKSRIISKSISMAGGKNIFRGLVDIKKSATDSKSFVQCDSLLVDEFSAADAIPTEIVANNRSSIDHEARIATIDPDEMEYLLIKGISKDKCEELLILGFANEFDSELPMEYAIEFNRLLRENIEVKND